MNPIIVGTVIGGHQLGRRLGYPTANLSIPADLAVDNGVWAARVTVEGRTYGALGYVGRKPTVDQDGQRVLEVHLLDFNGDLYGRSIRVELLQYVRTERRFASTEDLLQQIDRDKQAIIKILTSCG